MFFRKLYGEYLRHVRRTSPVVDKLPRVVQIEPINVCNLDCPVCSVHHISETKRRYLRAEEFRKIAEQLEPETHIYLVGWGEPFLNPEVFEVIREGKRLGHIMAIDSNLNIDPELVPKIVDSGLDILKASIDGATQENYEKYRIKGDFDKAFGNLSGLVEEKIRINSATPKLSWQFIVNRHSEKDMDRARELVASLPGPVKLRFISMGLRQEKVDWMNYSGEEMEDMKKECFPQIPKLSSRSSRNSVKKQLPQTRGAVSFGVVILILRPIWTSTLVVILTFRNGHSGTCGIRQFEKFSITKNLLARASTPLALMTRLARKPFAANAITSFGSLILIFLFVIGVS